MFDTSASTKSFSEEKIHHYLISGRVQGVGFRAFTQKTARELGIRGRVRNLRDGRVEVIAEGEKLSEFENILRRGPAHAKVEEFEKTLIDEKNEGAGFTMLEDGETPWK